MTASFPWIARAYSQLGVREIPGRTNNPTIVDYHGVTHAGKAPDEVPWCSSFVCWCFEHEGITSTRDKSSQSWRTWKGACPLGYGCVGVIRNPIRRNRGHVGFVVGYYHDPDRPARPPMIVLLGGNQGNEVSIRAYPIRRFVAFRMPALYVPDSLPLIVPPAFGGSTR